MTQKACLVSAGAFLPRLRLSDEALTEVWKEGGAAWGQRAVFGPDEDCFTMAVEAAANALTALPAGSKEAGLDALYFACPNPPDQRQPLTPQLLLALGLAPDTPAFDLYGSERAAADAFSAAVDGVRSGQYSQAMVIVSDAPTGEPGSGVEWSAGAGAAALVVGKSGPVEVVSYQRLGGLFPFRTQPAGSRFTLQYPDPRFERDEGVLPAFRRLVARVTEEHPAKSLSGVRLAAVSVDAPRARQRLFRTVCPGVKAELVMGSLGHPGSAAPFLDLVAALTQSQAGDEVLVLAFGAGGTAEAILVQVRAPMPSARAAGGGGHDLDDYVKSGLAISYSTYLRQQRLLQPGLPHQLEASFPAYWRSLEQRISLRGERCRKCGRINYPTRKICMACNDSTEFVPVDLSRCGTVYSHTQVHFGPPGTEPEYGIALVDLPEGIRVIGLLVAGESDLAIGAPVDLVWRRITVRSGLVEYGYRIRPQSLFDGEGGR